MGSEQFGSGGTRRIPASKIKKSKSGGSHKPPKKKCCPMVEAIHSVKQGNYRLARRYAVLSAKLIAARVAA